MKKMILLLPVIFISAIAAVTSINPISISNEMAGVYKMKSAIGNYTNGNTLNLTATQLDGSKYIINQNGILSSILVYNGTILKTGLSYFTHLTSTTATTYDMIDGSSTTVNYTMANNILTITITALDYTEVDTFEKIVNIDNNYLYTADDLQENTNTTKDYCKNYPASCGIALIEKLNSTDILELGTGWNLTGTMHDIENMHIFDNTTIVWIYDKVTKKWKAYSSNTNTIDDISNAGYNIISTIPKNSGIWVLNP